MKDSQPDSSKIINQLNIMVNMWIERDSVSMGSEDLSEKIIWVCLWYFRYTVVISVVLVVSSH